jgi:RES domain-containing protein
LRVWRLTRLPFARAPFDGVGPARGGGRWNSRGTYVAYASSSRALAVLEVLVHINRGQAPTDYMFIEADIPDDAVETFDVRKLQPGWQAEPPPANLREIGDQWVRTNRWLALRVPSALVPDEANYPINPAHRRFAEIQIIGMPQAAVLDPRLLR